jgi:hypothetical protein
MADSAYSVLFLCIDNSARSRVISPSRVPAFLAAQAAGAFAGRAQLSEIVQRVRDGRLQMNIGTVSTLGEAVVTFNSTERRAGKTIIRVRP